MDAKIYSQKSFKRILYCTDFSENSDFAFDFALSVAAQNYDKELFLIHIVPESDSQFWKTYIYDVEDVDSKAKQDIDRRISDAYISKLPDGMTLNVNVVVGKNDQEILNFANENKIDLIVIGREGHSSLQETLFGNISEKLVRKALCPVMVIPLSFKNK